MVVLLSFFPFFRYLPLGTVESQPVGGAVALLGLLYFGIVNVPVVRAYLALGGIMLVSGVVAVLGHGVPVSMMLPQLAAYVTPIVTILYLWGRIPILSTKLVLAAGLSYIIMGTAQFLQLVPGPIESILSAAIPRYQSEMVGGGRGIVMFTPEPSYAAKQILMFMAFLLAFWRDGRMQGRLTFWLLAVSLVAMVVLNRSIIGIGLAAILVGTFAFLMLSLRGRLLLGTMFAGSLFLLFVGLQTVDSSAVTQGSPRIVQISVSFAQAFAKGTFGFKDVVRFGSARVVTNVGGIRSVKDGGLLGAGIGNAEAAVKVTLENDPLLSELQFDTSRFNTLKPEGWVIAFVVETGLLGLIVFMIAMVRTVAAAQGNTRQGYAASVAIFVTGFIQLLLLGPQSLPAPWIMLMLVADHTARARAK